MQGHRVAFDPSTKKRYKKGTPMLDVVTSGTYFVVDDFTQIHRLHEYRERLAASDTGATVKENLTVQNEQGDE
jgi:hypothetical protein